jgi:hypothetical protein
VRFVNALIKSGITVHRATAAFTVAGKQYPANSLVVKTAQPFRPHVMDMFEPQDHPDDIPYPGAPPTAPYDNAGYTLAFQMGVQFDRILDGFDGPFQTLTDFAKAPAGAIKTAQGAPVGYYFSHQATDSFSSSTVGGGQRGRLMVVERPMGYGTFYVAAKPTTLTILQKAADDLGVSFRPRRPRRPGRVSCETPHRPRRSLRRRHAGGLTRLVFKNFEFPFVEDSENDVFGPDINAGNLHAKYDVLVFNNEAMGGGGGRGGRGGGGGAGGGGDVVAAEPPLGGAAGDCLAHRLHAPLRPRRRRGGGDQTAAAATIVRVRSGDPAKCKRQARSTQRYRGAEAVRQDGGTIVAIGSSANGAIQMFGLPLADQVTVGRTEYFSVRCRRLKNPWRTATATRPLLRQQPRPRDGSDPHTVAWFATRVAGGWACGQSISTRASDGRGDGGQGPRSCSATALFPRSRRILLQRAVFVRGARDGAGAGQ